MIIGRKASAGAGKTFALATRYIYLLGKMPPSSDSLRRIVAITFTNKAAAEMRERILRFLKEIAFETDFYKDVLKNFVDLTPERASQWIGTIITGYSDFHVRTIDSLLLAILRGLTFELGLRPELTVLFSEKKLCEEAFDIVFSDPSKRDLWAKVLETYLEYEERGGFYPEGKIKKRLVDIYEKIETVDLKTPFEPEEIKEEVNNALEELKRAYEELLRFKKEHEGKVNGNTFRVKESVDLKYFIDLCKKMRTLEKGPPENLIKKEFKGELIDELTPLWQSYNEKFIHFCNAIKKWPYVRLKGYLELLKIMKELVKEISTEQGIVLGSKHWTDLIIDEIRKDGVPPLIYAHFAAKFRDFLVDEFQDTSEKQWQALKPIFEDILAYGSGGSLFLVGDSKQAIYGWRDGDWRIYERTMRGEEFPSVGTDSIYEETLPCNHRSHPELVEFFNLLFKRFSDRDTVIGIAETFLKEDCSESIKSQFVDEVITVFSQCEQKPARRDSGDGLLRTHPRIAITRLGDRNSAKDEVKERLRDLLVKEVKGQWQLWSSLQTEGTPIAVLLRKNDTVEEVSSWLLQEGIPVVTDSALKIGISSVVKAVVSFLHLVSEPEEEVYLYGFLSSGILKDGPGDEKELIELWIDENSRGSLLQRVNELVQSLRQRMPELDPYQLIYLIVAELGLEERLKGDLSPHRPFLEKLLELAHTYVIEEGPDLVGFLDYLQDEGVEARVGLPENIRAVRVMTVHKAKGLEFPVVFVPMLDWSLQKNEFVDVYKEEDNAYLVHLSGPLDERLGRHRDMKKMKEYQETLNLFYVALTRAQESVYVYMTEFQKLDSVIREIYRILNEVTEECKRNGMPVKETQVEMLEEVVE